MILYGNVFSEQIAVANLKLAIFNFLQWIRSAERQIFLKGINLFRTETAYLFPTVAGVAFLVFEDESWAISGLVGHRASLHTWLAKLVARRLAAAATDNCSLSGKYHVGSPACLNSRQSCK